MKTLTLSALALTVFAGVASAATSADFDRHGVDRADLTAAQELAISNAIGSDLSYNEVQSIVNTVISKG